MATPDPRPLLHRALTQLGALAEAVGPHDLDRPTPCEGWDVRTLLGHLVSVHRRIAVVGAGGDFRDVEHVTAVDDGAHPEALADGRAEVERVWGDDAVLDRVLTVPWGTMPGGAVGWGYVQEGTVHGWDLAVPLGLEGTLDGALAEAVEPVARQFLPAEPRGGPIPFGPPVEVDDDAGPYVRLVAWLGRTP